MTLQARLRVVLGRATPRGFHISGFSKAAVLVPIVERRGAPSLLFTARPRGMPTHAGQISFPGGRWEAQDPDAPATALREASEELGIEPAWVQVLGTLADVATPVGFVITPVVGWLEDPPALRPDPREVEACFEVSLEEIANPALFAYRGERVIAGHTYTLPEYHVAGRVIWGATARVVQLLLEVLAEA